MGRRFFHESCMQFFLLDLHNRLFCYGHAGECDPSHIAHRIFWGEAVDAVNAVDMNTAHCQFNAFKRRRADCVLWQH